MKHPLTSKERRGLLAVAAAALLCIGSGFIFRNCPSGRRSGPKVVVVDNDSVAGASRGDSIAVSDRTAISDSMGNSKRSDFSETSENSGKTRKSRKSDKSEKSSRHRKSKKVRQEKTYPTRSPLDEPIGQ